MNYQAVIVSPIGRLGIKVSETHLIGIDFLAAHHAMHPPTRQLAQQVTQELQVYFRTVFFNFTVPYVIVGTRFQKQVWQALVQIPIGKTVTYGELANRLGTSPRAVGNACRANPLPIIIPCHRVVGQKNLGGYYGMGETVQPKVWLLEHEGALESSSCTRTLR
jgi:methylated-DNA-[protein]-cysteine S-methyltransferase